MDKNELQEDREYEAYRAEINRKKMEALKTKKRLIREKINTSPAGPLDLTKEVAPNVEIQELIDFLNQYGKISDERFVAYANTLNVLREALETEKAERAKVIIDKLYQRFQMLRRAYEGPSEVYDSLARMLNDDSFMDLDKSSKTFG